MANGIKLQKQPKRVGFDRFNNRYLDEDFVNERISRNRRMADMLMGQNANTVVQSPTQGLAMLARALNARDYNRNAEREQTALRDQYNAQLGALMQSIPQNLQGRAQGLPRGVLEQVAAQDMLRQMEPPDPLDVTTKPFTEDDEIVTRYVINGKPIPGEEGVFSRGPRSLVQQTETGPPGSFTTGSQIGAQQIEADRQLASLNAFGSMSTRLLDVAKNVEGANTLVGQLANVGNQIGANIRTLGTQLGIEFGQGVFDPGSYEGFFEAQGLAGASAQVKNGFIGLAVQKAIASGMGAGKALSDNDVRLMLGSLGANQGDPAILQNLLSESFMGLEDIYNSRIQATEGLKGGEVIRPDWVQPFIPEQTPPGVAEPQTQEEYDNLPSGARYMYEGKIRIKQ